MNESLAKFLGSLWAGSILLILFGFVTPSPSMLAYGIGTLPFTVLLGVIVVFVRAFGGVRKDDRP